MNVVWDAGACTVADVWQALAARRRVARNTVQTMLVRLEEKGWLTHREAGGAFVYSAAVPREQAQQRSVERMLDTVFRGSAEGLVLTLLQSRGLSKDEAARIRPPSAASQIDPPRSSYFPRRLRRTSPRGSSTTQTRPGTGSASFWSGKSGLRASAKSVISHSSSIRSCTVSD
jgi:predicted transcriptional regulator